MPIVQANLFVVARISSVPTSVTVTFEERRPPSATPTDDRNHLLIGLYSRHSSYRQLLHESWIDTPRRIAVNAAGTKPNYVELHTAAMTQIPFHFPGLGLEALPSAASYWTGTYWKTPKPLQFVAGFRFLDGSGQVVQGNLRVLDAAGAPKQLRMDFLAVVQSLT